MTLGVTKKRCHCPVRSGWGVTGWPSSEISYRIILLTDPSRYNCRPEISKMGRELQKWAEPPKWGGSLRANFHDWLWLQPIVIDLHFKINFIN